MQENIIKITARQPHIHKLPQLIINQIAAGEVVERPASVIKELVENSIDAGATKIEISIKDGGKSFIQIKDNGIGINRNDLPLALERHATSKLETNDLFDIHTFGFRGEALASIASISRITIQSKFIDDDTAYSIKSDEYGLSEIYPSSLAQGTTIDVSDLFYATPARLKFLKTTHAEEEACGNIIQNIALAYPNINFKYISDGKLKFEYKPTDVENRIKDIFGDVFFENIKKINVIKDNFKIEGYIGVPNFNKSTTSYQRFFVNGRYIKDKQLNSILRSAYKEVIPPGRYPVCILYLTIDKNSIDVNVHPAKTEVRFKDFEIIKGLLFSIIKRELQTNGVAQNASSAMNRLGLTEAVRNSIGLQKKVEPTNYKKNEINQAVRNFFSDTPSKENIQLSHQLFQEKELAIPSRLVQPPEVEKTTQPDLKKDDLYTTEDTNKNATSQAPQIDLGQAIMQLNEKYIISVTADNQLIIVDQHAICERITLEKITKNMRLESQQLLSPELIVLQPPQVELILKYKEILESFGIFFDKTSFDTIWLRGIPAIFSIESNRQLIVDIIEELEESGFIDSFEEKIRLIFSTISCHNSIRAGKLLNKLEMNSLLRQAENTPNIAQCCHGRPSYISLNIKDLDSLFER